MVSEMNWYDSMVQDIMLTCSCPGEQCHARTEGDVVLSPFPCLHELEHLDPKVQETGTVQIILYSFITVKLRI